MYEPKRKKKKFVYMGVGVACVVVVGRCVVLVLVVVVVVVEIIARYHDMPKYALCLAFAGDRVAEGTGAGRTGDAVAERLRSVGAVPLVKRDAGVLQVIRDVTVGARCGRCQQRECCKRERGHAEPGHA